MTEITLCNDEHIEYLSKELGLVVSKEHTFGTDALLLADFASPKRCDICCDFGTGCGIIPMLWCRDGCGKEISAVEIQEKACDQLTRSVRANKLQDKLFVYNADLKETPLILPCGKFDVITMNPPYKAENAGIKSRKENEKIARHETLCNLRDIAKAASKLLKFGGRLCVCIRPERLFETMEAMKEYKIEPKALRLVAASPEKAPWLCLIEGKLGGKTGMTVKNNLFVYKDKDVLSDEMMRILGKYREDM